MFDGFPVSEEERQRNIAKLQSMIKKRYNIEEPTYKILGPNDTPKNNGHRRRRLKVPPPTNTVTTQLDSPKIKILRPNESNTTSIPITLVLEVSDYNELKLIQSSLNTTLSDTIKHLIVQYNNGIKKNNGGLQP